MVVVVVVVAVAVMVVVAAAVVVVEATHMGTTLHSEGALYLSISYRFCGVYTYGCWI